MILIHRLKQLMHSLKRDVHAVWFAARDPRTPWSARALALCVAGYALSPIDLIPDFIPGLGYLDDLLIVSLGLMLILRLTPPALMVECRAMAEAVSKRPVSWMAAGFVIVLWVAALVLLIVLWY